MCVARFALSNVAERLHFYIQVKNCRVCRQCITRFAGFVGISVTRFALSSVAESMLFYVQVHN